MEEQYLQIDNNFDNTFGKIVNKYLTKIEQIKIPATPKYQFQELNKKLFPFYGQKIFQLPYRTFYSDYKLEEAHRRCVKYNQAGNIKYLIKIMKSLPY